MPTSPESLLPIIGQLEGSDKAAVIQSQRLRRPVTPDQVVSPMGAVGRYQVMPATAKALGFDPALLTDPAHNEGAAKAAIADLIRQHGDDKEAIIVGYNASPAVVNKWKKNGRNINFLPAETRGYLERARVLLASAQNEPEVESGPKGLRDYQRLIDAGYPQAQADQWRMETIGKLQAGGFSQGEIDAYFGTTEHKTTSLNQVVQGNVEHNWTPEEAVKATTPWGALAAGWDMSTSALALAGPPKTILPENAGLMADVLYGLGQFAGDIPASVIGFIGGGAAGTAAGLPTGPGAPIVGTAAAFAGSAALPEAMRQVLMDQYRNGDFSSFGDFVSRSSSMAWETAKAGTIGAVGGTAGRAVGGKIVEKVGAGMLATGAEQVTFAAASTTTGAALNGRVPDAKDFSTAVATMLGAHVAFKVVGAGGRMVMSRRGEEVAQNMQKVYASTGIPPWEQAKRASGDAVMRQEILGQDADGSAVTPALNRVKPREPEPFKKPSVPTEAKAAEQAAPSRVRTKYGFFLEKDAEKLTRLGDEVTELEKKGGGEEGSPHRAAYEEANEKFAQARDEAVKALRMSEKVTTEPKADAEPAAPQPPVVGFATAKGSTYEVDAKGKTTRTKAARTDAGHEGDFGLKPASDRTIYVDPKDAPALSAAGLEGLGPKGARLVLRNGKASLATWNEGAQRWGVSPSSRDIPYTEVPEIGKSPVEAWKPANDMPGVEAYRGQHAGNPITEIKLSEQAQTQNQIAAIQANDVIIPQGVGLNHVNPDIAQRYGFDPAALANPEYNTKAANAILDDLSKQFKNADGSIDQQAVLIGYVAGPGRAIRYRADGRNFDTLPPPVQRYMLHAERMGAFEGGGGGGKKPPPPGGADSPPDEGPSRLEGPEQVDPFELNSQMLAERINEITAQPVQRSTLETLKSIPERAYFEAVSELAPFKRLDREMGLKPDEIGLEDVNRSTYASPGRALHFVRMGTLEPIGIDKDGVVEHFKKTSDEYLFKGYEEAKKIGISIDEVVAYRRAARTVELAKRGIETPTDIKDATAMVAKLKDKMQPIVEMFDRVNDAKLDYMRDSGLLSAEGTQAIKDQNRYWIPYNPAREGGYKRTGSRFGPTNIIRKIKGGKYQTVDPITQEIQSFYNAIPNADKNRATVALARVLSLPKNEHVRQAIGLEEITDQRTKPELFDKYGNPIEEMQKTLGPLSDDQFAYFDNGVRHVMKTNDAMLASAIRGASPVELGMIFKTIRWFAQVKRAGIVEMPDYMARAMAKDVVGAAVLEKWGGANLGQIYDAAMHVIKGDDVWKDWNAKGGLGTALADMDAKYIARDVNKLFSQSGTWQRITNTAMHPLQAAGILMQRMDAIVRIAEAERMKGAGIDPFKATMNARKINLDFSEHGANQVIQVLASITPFFRPSVLGIEQLARSVRNDPLGTTVRAAAYIAAPTAILYAMNYVQERSDPTIPEDQKWLNLPRWQKDTMFVLPRIGGVRLRVPMPPVIGPVVGGLTNRFLDYFAQSDPRAFHDWANTLLAQLAPPIVPAIGLPIYEHWANKNSFSGKPLIPDALEGAAGYMQYVDYTSEVAKKIAQWIGPPGVNLVDVSPIVLDNYVRQWTGPMGFQIMRITDATVFPETGKPWEFADIPIIGSFTVRNPGMSAQTIQDFYDNLKGVRKANTNLSLSLKRQDIEEFDLASANTLAFLKLESIAESISIQRGTLDAINKDREMPIDDKRQLMETIYAQVIAESGFGLAIIDTMADYEQGGQPPVNMLQSPGIPAMVQ